MFVLRDFRALKKAVLCGAAANNTSNVNQSLTKKLTIPRATMDSMPENYVPHELNLDDPGADAAEGGGNSLNLDFFDMEPPFDPSQNKNFITTIRQSLHELLIPRMTDSSTRGMPSVESTANAIL